MPFIPHTDEDRRVMLKALGLSSLEDLFAEIPRVLRCEGLDLPPALSEMEIIRLMRERAGRSAPLLCFAGGGAYEHHIPAAVWEILGRGELYSAYTPYQPEASQGTLQLVYEYQSMMTELMAMEVSNASLYDGASALAEAVLMAVRVNCHGSAAKVVVPRSLHPMYRKVTATIVSNQNIEIVEVPFDLHRGMTDPDVLDRFEGGEVTALVIPQPNFFGVLEEVDMLTDWAASHGALSIAVVNPMAMAILKPPGEWGEEGADIACGEGQPLGIPLSLGGPYFGFLTSRMEYLRQIPGRIAGATVDAVGKRGYVLTLQAREQHIRRSRATSNICTNQGLLTAAATLYLALLGPEGLTRVAQASHSNLTKLIRRLAEISGVEERFESPVFHEAVMTLPGPATEILRALAHQGILGGVALSPHYPELGNTLLVCATETRTVEDIDRYARELATLLTSSQEGEC